MSEVISELYSMIGQSKDEGRNLLVKHTTKYKIYPHPPLPPCVHWEIWIIFFLILGFGETKSLQYNTVHQHNPVYSVNFSCWVLQSSFDNIPCQAMPCDAVSLTNYLKEVNEQTESSINLTLTTTESWTKMSSSGDVWTMRILLSCWRETPGRLQSVLKTFLMKKLLKLNPTYNATLNDTLQSRPC